MENTTGYLKHFDAAIPGESAPFIEGQSPDMYRSSGNIPMARAPTLSTVVEGDQEMEETLLLERLEKKRKELDEEIASFKALKDKEFRKFEKSLRKSRKTSGTSSKSKNKSIGSSTLNVESSNEKRLSVDNENNGCSNGTRTANDQVLWHKSDAGSSPEQAWTKQLRKVDSNDTSNNQNPSQAHLFYPQPEATTPTAYERERDFRGLFTPEYLPLLGSQQSNSSTERNIQRANQTAWASGLEAESDNAKRASTNDITPLSNADPTATPPSSSLPPIRDSSRWSAPIIPTLNTTSSSIASTSLPSALRSPHHTRTRASKHVHFQLENGTARPSSPFDERRPPIQPSNDHDTNMPEQLGNSIFSLPSDDYDHESKQAPDTLQSPKLKGSTSIIGKSLALEAFREPQSATASPPKKSPLPSYSSDSTNSTKTATLPFYNLSRKSSPRSPITERRPSVSDDETFLFDEELEQIDEVDKVVKAEKVLAEKQAEEEAGEGEEDDDEAEGDLVASFSGSVPIDIPDSFKRRGKGKTKEKK